MAFSAAVDIANRACQHLGIRRIATLGDNSPGATEINACFDKLRQAELNAHVWRFACRRAAIDGFSGCSFSIAAMASAGVRLDRSKGNSRKGVNASRSPAALGGVCSDSATLGVR